MEEKNIPYSAMLVELDCLLDTRISILSELEDDKLKEVLYMYHSRDIDSFPHYSFNRFKEAYDKRTREVLKEALVTPIMSLIIEFVDKTLLNLINTPFHQRPKIIINIFPYELKEEEINNIISLIIVKTKGNCTVEVINKNIKELTVGYVKDNIAIMVMYKYYEWIEYHSTIKAFNTITCPEVAMFGPSIYFREKQPNLNIKEDPVRSMEELAKPLIGLKLFPIELFSFIRPNLDKKETTTS